MSNKTKTERVLVNIRIRPFSEEEKKKNPTSPIENLDLNNNAMEIKREYDSKTFSFDKIYPMETTQEDVFTNSAQKVVDSVLKGYNGTIFAYGQTGTGKTYTMVGDFDNKVFKGIIPRSFDYIFNAISEDKEHKYNDLLEPKNKDIRIREDPEKGVYLDGVQWVKINSTNDCRNIFHLGEKNRVTESTKMNAHSSRSHAILIAQIEKSITLSKEKIEELSKQSKEKIKAERVMTKSSLFLVDLAGSERVKKTKAENMRLEEAKKINYSLLILGNCIQSLTENKGKNYVSYRDSKLTRLLQESLGGNAKTSLIVNVSPSSYNTEETISSLRFASRAMKVKNKPIINKSIDYQALNIKLQEDLDKLSDKYTLLKIDYDKLLEKYNKIKNGETYVELQKKSMENSIGKEGERDDSDNVRNKSGDTTNSIKDIKILKVKENKILDNKVELSQEMKKLETFYKRLLKNKIEKYETILKNVDKILYEKENSMDKLINENKDLQTKVDLLNDSVNDLQKEKEDLMNSVSDLTNKLNFEKETNKMSNSQEQKKELEKLNNIIDSYEKKIIPLEKMNILNEEDISNYQYKIDQIINQLKLSKQNFEQKKSNLIIKNSQNEIKIKLNKDEVENLKQKLPTVSDEMKKILNDRLTEALNEIKIKERENIKNKKEEENINNSISSLDKEVKIYKNLKLKFKEIKTEEIASKNKTELYCEKELNEVSNDITMNKYEISQKRIKELEEEILSKEKENEYILNTNDKLKIENQSLNNVISKGANEVKDDELKKIKNELLKEKQINKEGKKMNDDYETMLHSYGDELKKLKESLVLKEKEEAESNNKINELQNTILLIKNNFSKKEKNLLNSVNELSGAKIKDQNIEEALNGYKKEISNLKSEIKSKEKIIADSIKANETINKLLKEKEDTINYLENKKDEIDNLSKEKNELRNFKDNLFNVNKEMKILNEKIVNDFNEKEKKLKNKIQNMDKEIIQLNELISSLSEEKDKLIQDKTDLIKQINKEKNQYEISFQKFNEELKNITNEKEEALNQNDKNEREIALLNNKIKLLQQQNDEIKENNMKLIKDLNYKDKEMTSIAELNKHITEQILIISKKENEISYLKDEICNLNKKYSNEKTKSIQNLDKENLKKNQSNNQEISKIEMEDVKNKLKEEMDKNKIIEIKYNELLNSNKVTQNELNNIKNLYKALSEEREKNTGKGNIINGNENLSVSKIESSRIENKIVDLYNKTLVKSKEFILYQNEIGKIQDDLQKNQPIDLAPLNELLDTQDSSNEDDYNNKIINEDINKGSPIDKCIKGLNDKFNLSKQTFKHLLTAYIQLIEYFTNNNGNNEIDEIKASLLANMTNNLSIISTINKSSTELMQWYLINKKKLEDIITIENSRKNRQNYIQININNIISLSSSISNGSIAKLVSSNNNKDEEIDHLNEKISYFLKEIEVIKKSNDEDAVGKLPDNKVQRNKYTNQLKSKNEEINRLNKRLSELLILDNKNKKEISSLKKDNKSLKNQLGIQNKTGEISEKNKIQVKNKNENNDLNTGKFLIKEYLNKVKKISGDLYSYCEREEIMEESDII